MVVPGETTPEASTHGRLLTPAQLAERWSVAVSQVWRLGRDGKVPVVMVGRYMRFRLADVEAWEQSGGVGQ
jgi:excisionase family DNA binding protein